MRLFFIFFILNKYLSNVFHIVCNRVLWNVHNSRQCLQKLTVVVQIVARFQKNICLNIFSLLTNTKKSFLHVSYIIKTKLQNLFKKKYIYIASKILICFLTNKQTKKQPYLWKKICEHLTHRCRPRVNDWETKFIVLFHKYVWLSVRIQSFTISTEIPKKINWIFYIQKLSWQ